MTRPRFVQLHTLVSYSAALLNRDDSGFAKRLPFGGAIRTRISSQCLKRHWRKAQDEWALASIGPEMAVRSRKIPEERILPALEAAGVGNAETRTALVEGMARLLYTPKDKTPPMVKDRQALLIGEVEIRYLTARLVEIARNAETPKHAVEKLDEWFKRAEKNNLQAMLNHRRGALEAGLEAALFGRMVTSDPDANTDAAIHVAHAFTVHAEEAETDYFTVVDDLETGTGAGGIFDTEITAGLFYLYVVVDVPALLKNLDGDAALVGKVVEHLTHLIATVSPGAKKGSTAPYAYADLVLAETGDRQPRSLANAFRDAGKANVRNATDRLTEYLARLDRMYGAKETRRVAALDPNTAIPGAAASLNIDCLARALATEVAGA